MEVERYMPQEAISACYTATCYGGYYYEEKGGDSHKYNPQKGDVEHKHIHDNMTSDLVNVTPTATQYLIFSTSEVGKNQSYPSSTPEGFFVYNNHYYRDWHLSSRPNHS